MSLCTLVEITLLLAAGSPASEHPSKLYGQADVDAELLRKRPHGLVVPEELPREEDDVETLLFQDLLRDGRSVDVADSPDEERVADGLLDSDGERCLVRRCFEVDAKLLLGMQPTRSHVDKVYAVLCQKLCELDGVFDGPRRLIGEDLLKPVIAIHSYTDTY